jgi:hypothetical protein
MSDLTENTAGNLIAAQQVTGSAVYNGKGEKLGHIADIMIDKVSGRAIYAIMSFGGFLGMGEKQHPLPWATLHYDERIGSWTARHWKLRRAISPTTSSGRRSMAARSIPTITCRATGSEPALARGQVEHREEVLLIGPGLRETEARAFDQGREISRCVFV